MAEEWKTFKTGVTVKALALCSVPLLCSILLLGFAADAFRKFHYSDPVRPLFAGVPAVLSLAIVVSIAAVFRHYLNRTVRVKGKLLEYKDPKIEFKTNIATMAYSPPGESRFKTLMLSDGQHFVQMPELFMSAEDFAVLAEHIRKRRLKRRTSSKTYSL